MSTDAKIGLATCLACLILVAAVFATTPITEYNAGFDSDGLVYGAMAGGDERLDASWARLPPWCYRVVTPFLASLLPWSTLQNFRVLAFVSNVLSLMILFAILGRFGFSLVSRALGVMLYAGVFWTLKFSFYSPAYIDYQTQLLLLAIILLTLREHFVLLLPVLALAALQKESLAAYSLFPVAYFLIHRRHRFSAWSGILCLSLLVVPAAALLVVRCLVPATEAVSKFTVDLSLFTEAGAWSVFVQATFSGLGVLPVVLAVRYGRWLTFLNEHREWLPYLAISLASLFVGTDIGRLYLYLLPLVIVLSLIVIEDLRRDVASGRFVAWAVAGLGVHGFMGGYLTPMGSFEDYLNRMVPEHASSTFQPYLVRNLLLSVLLMAVTVLVLIQKWRFQPKMGFTRRPESRSWK